MSRPKSEDIEIVINTPNTIISSVSSDGTQIDRATATDHPPPIRVRAAPINLIFQTPTPPISCKAVGFLNIGVEASVYHGERVSKLHSATPGLVMGIVGYDSTWNAIQSTWEARKTCPFELNHLIGRLDLTLKMIDLGVKRFQWTRPEAGLHPAWQVEMGDLLIELTKGDDDGEDR